jgi:hypothetical protein
MATTAAAVTTASADKPVVRAARREARESTDAADTSAIDALLGVREPYAAPTAADDAAFAAAMAAADAWHRARNPAYARLWDGDERPVIPVGLFKAADLTTPVPGGGTWLTSTGTSGGARTKVLFDDRSMARIGVAMLQMFLHARFFDIAPARFLILAPDPDRAPQAGYATAFQKFTACAPNAERVHAVADDGAFLPDVAWSALRRWTASDRAVFIFGLTVYFERLVLSATGPVPQRGLVKGLTGGGWKGMQKQLTRPEVVARLRALLPAPSCDVRDLFGLTEHPLHYLSCTAGSFHAPKYARFRLVGPDGREPPPGEPGLIRLQCPFFASIPGHDLLTEDRGALARECPCGVHTPNLRFLGRVTRPTGTCAANAAEVA